MCGCKNSVVLMSELDAGEKWVGKHSYDRLLQRKIAEKELGLERWKIAGRGRKPAENGF